MITPKILKSVDLNTRQPILYITFFLYATCFTVIVGSIVGLENNDQRTVSILLAVCIFPILYKIVLFFYLKHFNRSTLIMIEKWKHLSKVIALILAIFLISYVSIGLAFVLLIVALNSFLLYIIFLQPLFIFEILCIKEDGLYFEGRTIHEKDVRNIIVKSSGNKFHWLKEVKFDYGYHCETVSYYLPTLVVDSFLEQLKNNNYDVLLKTNDQNK